jgi:integrase
MTKISNLLTRVNSEKRERLAILALRRAATPHRTSSFQRVYRNLARKIESYEASRATILYTDSFSDIVIDDFVYFLKEKNYRSSTIRSFCQKIVTILHVAQREGYKVNIQDNLTLPSDEGSKAIYLSLDELQRLHDMQLKSENAAICDIFLIGCFTALRYSDYSKLTRDNLIGNDIVIKTKKTGVVVRIPMHPYVREIFDKYHYFLPPMKSQQNFNKVIKTICKRAAITDPVRIERTVGLKIERKNYPKWQLVSSHTARRSGATNMYLAGIPVFRIMLITGHKTQESFFRYIRITAEENATILANHPFFKK